MWGIFKRFKKKDVRIVIKPTAFEKLMSREIQVDMDVSGSTVKVTLKHLTFPQQFEVDNQAKQVARELEERGNDPQVLVSAEKSVRLEMLLFFSCHANGKRLFQDPLEVSDVLPFEKQIKLLAAYAEAFMLTEEERGNWWRAKTQASPT